MDTKDVKKDHKEVKRDLSTTTTTTHSPPPESKRSCANPPTTAGAPTKASSPAPVTSSPITCCCAGLEARFSRLLHALGEGSTLCYLSGVGCLDRVPKVDGVPRLADAVAMVDGTLIYFDVFNDGERKIHAFSGGSVTLVWYRKATDDVVRINYHFNRMPKHHEHPDAWNALSKADFEKRIRSHYMRTFASLADYLCDVRDDWHSVYEPLAQKLVSDPRLFGLDGQHHHSATLHQPYSDILDAVEKLLVFVEEDDADGQVG